MDPVTPQPVPSAPQTMPQAQMAPPPVVAQPQVNPQAQGMYQPVGVPAAAPKHPGKVQGILGIVCGVISLLFLPIVFGPAGIILGVLALKKGEKALGITAIIMSAIFMVAGMGLGIFVRLHPEIFEQNSVMPGAVIEAFSQSRY